MCVQELTKADKSLHCDGSMAPCTSFFIRISAYLILDDTPRVAAEICGGFYKPRAMKYGTPMFGKLVCRTTHIEILLIEEIINSEQKVTKLRLTDISWLNMTQYQIETRVHS
jgi:hypothetical protein